MKIKTIIRSDVIWVDVGDSLADAASKLQFYEVGSLVVYDERQFVGIITERDLVRAVADGVSPARESVSRYMTETPAVVHPDTEADDAAGLMLEMGVRHLPVLDGDRLVGMVSARDLLAEEHALIVSSTGP